MASGVGGMNPLAISFLVTPLTPSSFRIRSLIFHSGTSVWNNRRSRLGMVSILHQLDGFELRDLDEGEDRGFAERLDKVFLVQGLAHAGDDIGSILIAAKLGAFSLEQPVAQLVGALLQLLH